MTVQPNMTSSPQQFFCPCLPDVEIISVSWTLGLSVSQPRTHRSLLASVPSVRIAVQLASALMRIPCGGGKQTLEREGDDKSRDESSSEDWYRVSSTEVAGADGKEETGSLLEFC